MLSHTAVHLSHCFALSLCCMYSPKVAGLQNPAQQIESCSSVSYLLQGWSPCVCLHGSSTASLTSCLWDHVAEVTTEASPMIQTRPADLRLMLAGVQRLSTWLCQLQAAYYGMLHTSNSVSEVLQRCKSGAGFCRLVDLSICA